MDQLNFLDSQEKVTHFGTRCSLILDQFSLRNEPYETPSRLFCTKNLSSVEYKFIVKVYKHGDYNLQIDFLGDYDEEDFKDLTFFYMICDKNGKHVDKSEAVDSLKVSPKCSVRLMSDENFKNWTFVNETPLVLVFYIISHIPVSEKYGILTDVKKSSDLPLSYSHSSTECQLSTDLSNLYESGDLSDFNIVTKNKTFNVHKCVLAARSSVFAKYFENIENNDDSITLNVKSDVVEEMLRFIYTNSVQKLEELVVDLYNIAKEYNLRELQDKCTSHMMKSVSVDNAMSLLHFAKKHDEKALLGKITDFFVENTDQILASKTTDEFLKPLLDFQLSLSSA